MPKINETSTCENVVCLEVKVASVTGATSGKDLEVFEDSGKVLKNAKRSAEVIIASRNSLKLARAAIIKLSDNRIIIAKQIDFNLLSLINFDGTMWF